MKFFLVRHLCLFVLHHNLGFLIYFWLKNRQQFVVHPNKRLYFVINYFSTIKTLKIMIDETINDCKIVKLN